MVIAMEQILGSDVLTQMAFLNSFEEICDYVCNNAEDGDLVITLGCGDVYKVARMMCKKLKEREEQNV